MSHNELIEAMRPGSKNPLDSRDAKDLGRFGLGLKTASFSQCRKLTVVSSHKNNLSSAKWDLDHVAKKEDWSLQILDDDEINNIYKIDRLSENGTLVLWEDTDRIIDNTVKTKVEDLIYNKMSNLQKHLELTFHRYLYGKDKVNLFINDLQLEPFDPFYKKHPATQELSTENIKIDDKRIIIKPYILPHYTKMSSKDYEHYAGEGGYLKNQGFYVYRNKRLLISGTWFRLIPQSEMYKLARIQIDLPNSLDDIWKIDVKKSNASPPLIIKQRLKKIIDKITNSSTKIYRSRGHKNKMLDGSFWERTSARGEINYSINNEHPLIEEFNNSLDTEQQEKFTYIISLISSFIPKDSLYSDLGNNNPKDINKISITDFELEEKVLFLYQNNMISKESLSLLKNTEPFNKYTKDWETFLKENISTGIKQ